MEAKLKTIKALMLVGAGTLGMMACTGQLPGSLVYKQVEENLSVTTDVNTKIDMLWVVDNSSSMDVSQMKLREGFSAFAARYMKPTWDIRLAVISTDAYLANPAFSGYLSRTIPGTVGAVSTHIQDNIAQFSNPAHNPNLLNLTTGAFDLGLTYNDLNPQWGSSYATLSDGIHDGPIQTLCFEGLPYFFAGLTNCSVRDLRSPASSSAETCVSPGQGQDSLSECVNTVQNNTVHSGKAIIETRPPSGTAGDQVWIDGLIRDFTINVSAGSSGHGSERGISSLLQFIQDNESGNNQFFREGSLRVVIFVTDEEDQSMELPASPPADFSPFYDYACDHAGLSTMNGGAAADAICCTGGACAYGRAGTTCSSKTVGELTYTPSVCADETKLLNLASVKSDLDSFFGALDSDEENPNYMIANIIPLADSGIQSLQDDRDTMDAAVGSYRTWAVDRGDRYISLAEMVDENALSLDITSDDYTPILNAIGAEIIAKKSVFQLKKAPTGEDELIVQILHGDGSVTNVAYDDFVIEGKVLRITNEDLVLSLSYTDQIYINYQPKGQN